MSRSSAFSAPRTRTSVFVGALLSLMFAVGLVLASSLTSDAVVPSGQVPGVPVVSVVSKAETWVSLSWTVPDDGGQAISDYRVEYSTDGSNWSVFNDGVSTTASAKVTGLVRGTSYWFRVSAINVIGAGSSGSLSGSGVLSSGQGFSCVVMGDGSVNCWGYNEDGRLGDGTLLGSLSPVKVLGINNAVSVDAGNGHACALLADKTVKCWGLNSSGQLGNGTTTTSSTPVAVSGVTNAVAAVAGAAHSCALMADRTVKCWGYNADGRLGDGTFTSSSTPVDVAGVTTATSIVTGSSHSCAMLADGRIQCWGYNANGQIGNGSFTNSSTPVNVVYIDDATAISAGDHHTCALRSTSFVNCWGQNNAGQLADWYGTGVDRALPGNVHLSNGIAISDVVAISAGGNHTCLIRSDSIVGCWGYNSSGQLGDNTRANARFVSFTRMTSGNFLYGVSSISAGFDHTCVRRSDQTVQCWGGNEWGQLGTGTTNGSLIPVSALTGSVIPSVVPQKPSSLVSPSRSQTTVDLSWTAPDNGGRPIVDYRVEFSADGTTWTVFDDGVSTSTNVSVTGLVRGTNYRFRVSAINAEGPSVPSSILAVIPSSEPGVPVVSVVSKAETWVSLSWTVPDDGGQAISDYRVEYSTDGSNWSVFNDGVSTTSSAKVTGLVRGTPYWFRVSAINTVGVGSPGSVSGSRVPSAGRGFSCVVMGDGSVSCWGFNEDGRLGDGTLLGSLSPVKVFGINNAVSVDAGNGHACALLADKTVKCWGFNSSGQLGNGTTTTSSTPVAVSGVTNAIAVAAGTSHSCALLGDGTVQCWGNNDSGQLGDGTTTSSSTSVTVAGITTATTITVGRDHSCALLAAGTIQCWGYNAYGQLGNGTLSDSSGPVFVTALTGATSISAGDNHTCAVVVNRWVNCWGAGGSGELANGGNNGSSVPNSVYTRIYQYGYGYTYRYLSDYVTVTAVSAGGAHTCALTTAATVWCWGSNGSGQRGDGSTENTWGAVSVTSGAAGLDAGWNHTCISAQPVRCWGGNEWGQLGNGLTTGQSLIGSVIPSVVPQKPSSLVSPSRSQTTVDLSWTAPDNGGRPIVDYRVEFSADGTTWTVFDDGVSTSTNVSVTGLVRGTNYRFRVSAINAEGPSATSDVLTQATPTVPSSPTALSATSKTQTSVSLAWTAPSTDGGRSISDYKIEFSTDGTNWKTFNDGISTSVSVTVTGLIRGIGHTFRVSAINEEGTGEPSGGSQSVIPASVPAQVLPPFSNRKSASSVSISWVAPDDGGRPILDYRVEFRSKDSAWTLFDDGVAVATATTVTGLTRGTSYSFRVIAINAEGAGAPFSSAGAVLSTGGGGNCALRGNGSIDCWGYNEYGQLGNGTTSISSPSAPVVGISRAIMVSSGFYHACAVLAEGTVTCWGYNALGQLGNGTTASSSVPVMVSGVTNAVSVAAGDGHSCAVLADGTVACWGYNYSGQLGNGTTSNWNTPVFVSGVTDATAVAIGAEFTCALRSGGTVSCWGRADYGQLGNGPASNSSIPASVPGVSDATEISAGSFHACARLTDGTMKCWGMNWSGQLGTGGTGNWSRPVSVIGISNATALSAGWSHTCALLADGTIKCWGSNGDGALGNGTAVGSTQPTAVVGISNAIAISAGFQGTCAGLADSTIRCWGYNGRGELGNGTTADSLTPVRVIGSEVAWAVPTVIPSVTPSKLDPPLSTSKTETSVSLFWTAPDDGGQPITDYKVELSTNGTKWTTFTDGLSTSTSATVTGLTRGGSYSFRVSAVNADGTGAASGASAVVVPAVVPAAPTNVVSTSKSQTSVSLRWAAPDNGGRAVSDYWVEFSSNGVNWSVFDDGVSATTTATVTGLTRGTSYSFRVSAVNPEGTGSESAPSSAVVPATVPAAPTAVASTGKAATSVSLSWVAPDDGGRAVTDYKVEFSANGTNWSVFNDGTSTSTSVTVTGLTRSTLYSFRVSAVNVEGTGAAVSTTAVPAVVPAAPSSLVVSSKAATSLVLGWVAPDDGGRPVTDYRVEFSTDGTSWTTFNDGVSAATTATVTGLTRGVSYIVRVSAINVEGTGLGSTTTAIPAVVPGAPTGVASTGKTQTSVSLAWTAPLDDGGRAVTDYRVEFSTDGTSWTTFNDGTSTSTSATVTGLTRGVSHLFRVTAVNAEGAGAVSVATSAIITASVPGSPTSMAVTAKTATSVSLSWVAPDNGGRAVTDYRVEFSSNGVNWSVFDDGVSAATTAMVTGLTRGTSYTLRVSAINAEGTGLGSTTTVIPAVVPAASAAPTMSSKLATSVSLFWVAPDDGGQPISDYKVEFSTNGRTWSTFTDGVSTSTSATVTGLTRGTSYMFRVSAVNAEGTGSASSASASVIPAVVAGAPTGVASTGKTQTSVSLGWVAPDDGGRAVTDYRVEFSSDGVNWSVFDDGISVTTTATVTGLTRGTSYTFRVSAVNPEGTGVASAPSSGVIPATVPGVPTAVIATSKTQTTVSLTWSSPSDDGGRAVSDFRIEYSSDATTWNVFSDGVSASSVATVNGLTRGLTYTFRVSAINPEGSGQPSAASVGVIPAIVPAAPSAPALVSKTQTTATIGWLAPTDDGGRQVTDYRIEYSLDGTTWSVFPDGVSSAAAATVTGLTTGSSYQFRVTAANPEGFGLSSGSSVPVIAASAPAAPPTPTLTARSASTVSLSWFAPDNGGRSITDYRVEYSADGVTWSTFNDGVSTSSSVTVTGLTRGTSHQFRVAAVNAEGAGSYSGSLSVIPAIAPKSTSAPLVTGKSATSASISWAAPSDDGGESIVDYVIEYSSNGFTWSAFLHAPSPETAATVLGLTTGVQYQFRVAPVNGVGAGLASPASAPMIPSTVPSAPSTPVVASKTQVSATLTWTAPVDNGGRLVTDYRVEYSTDGLVWTVFDDGVSSNASSTLTGLTRGVSYVFRVAATNAEGTGPVSTGSTPALISTVPGAPSIAGSSWSSSTSLGLSWFTPDDGGRPISDYRIEYSTSGGAWTTVPHAPSTTTSITIQGLQSSLNYTIRVSALNGEGFGTPTEFTVNAASAPGAPTAVAGVAGDGQVTVSWSAPAVSGGAAITGYTVTSSPGGKTCSWSSGSLSCVVTGLTNATAYTFTVTARNFVGAGPASSASNAVTPRTIPSAPLGATTVVGSSVGAVSAVTIDASGNTFFTATDKTTAFRVSATGVVSTVGSGFSNPSGIAVDSTGRVYVADTLNNRVVRILPNGTTTTIGTGLKSPRGLFVTAVGDLFIADSGNNRIVKITSAGVQSVVGSGFSGPSGVAVDSGGSVYVADTGKNRVVKVPLTGAQTTIGTGFVSPTAVGVDGTGAVYVADRTNNRIVKVSTAGGLSEIRSGFSNPTGVAVNAAGDVTIGDTGNTRVVRITAVPRAVAGAGRVTLTWSAPSSNGGAVVTGYKVSVVGDPTKTCTTTGATTCAVTGLTRGVAYTFTVVAINEAGQSVPTSASASVTVT